MLYNGHFLTSGLFVYRNILIKRAIVKRQVLLSNLKNEKVVFLESDKEYKTFDK